MTDTPLHEAKPGQILIGPRYPECPECRSANWQVLESPIRMYNPMSGKDHLRLDCQCESCSVKKGLMLVLKDGEWR